jgi:hypothetical protein
LPKKCEPYCGETSWAGDPTDAQNLGLAHNGHFRALSFAEVEFRGPRLSGPELEINLMRLIFRNVAAKVRRHAQSDFQHVAIHHSRPRRPQTDRVGECRSATAIDDFQNDTAATEAPTSRSAVLDRPDEDLETMENSPRHRTTHYCCELAAAAIQTVLEQAIPEEGTRTSAGLYGTPEVGSNNGGG